MDGTTSQLALPSSLLSQLQNELKMPTPQGCHEAWKHVQFSTNTRSSCVCKPVCEEEEDGWPDSEQLKGFLANVESTTTTTPPHSNPAQWEVAVQGH